MSTFMFVLAQIAFVAVGLVLLFFVPLALNARSSFLNLMGVLTILVFPITWLTTLYHHYRKHLAGGNKEQ